MKEIKLTQGKVALVDDEDFDYLNQFKWQTHNHGHTYYARRVDKSCNGRRIYMHREIMTASKDQMLDHINGLGFDNRKFNLRFCTSSQNNANKKSTGASKYLGVWYHKSAKKWTAQIGIKGEHMYLGLFKSEENAAIAYNIFAEKHHGVFARLNTAL